MNFRDWLINESEEEGILQAMIDNLEDPTHSLVMADWLYDNNDPMHEMLRAAVTMHEKYGHYQIFQENLNKVMAELNKSNWYLMRPNDTLFRVRTEPGVEPNLSGPYGDRNYEVLECYLIRGLHLYHVLGNRSSDSKMVSSASEIPKGDARRGVICLIANWMSTAADTNDFQKNVVNRALDSSIRYLKFAIEMAQTYPNQRPADYDLEELGKLTDFINKISQSKLVKRHKDKATRVLEQLRWLDSLYEQAHGTQALNFSNRLKTLIKRLETDLH